MITINKNILALGVLVGLFTCTMRGMHLPAGTPIASMGISLISVIDLENGAYENFENRFAQALASRLPPALAFNLDLKCIGVPEKREYYSIRGLLTQLKLNVIYTQHDARGFEIRTKHIAALEKIIEAYDRADRNFFQKYMQNKNGSAAKSTIAGDGEGKRVDRDDKRETPSFDLIPIDREDDQEKQDWSFLSKKSLVIAGACLVILGALLWHTYGNNKKKADTSQKN